MTKVLLILAASLAACVSTATAGDWYASVYGGLNRNNVIELPFVDSPDGEVIGATVGRNLAGIPGLRIEADLSYRTNDVDLFGGFIEANHETTAAMFNVAYDIGSGPVKPYITGGIGWAQTSATFENIALLRIEASDLAYQAGAGVTVPIAAGVRFGVGYRFFQGPVVDVLGVELSDGTNHSLIANFTFDL